MYCIGIDTGKHTGFAVWDTEKRHLDFVDTIPIHEALLRIWSQRHANVEVYFEDARQRKWYGTRTAKEDRNKLQGAGSVKRDSTIW